MAVERPPQPADNRNVAVHPIRAPDPSARSDELLGIVLLRHARWVGARVEFDEGDGWRDYPDPLDSLRDGLPLSGPQICELNGMVPLGGWWVGFGDMASKYVANQIGCTDVDCVEQALDAVMRLQLRFLAGDWERDHGIGAENGPPAVYVEP